MSTKTFTKTFCDICSNECDPIREITTRLNLCLDGGKDVKLKFIADVAYCKNDGDICNNCALKALEMSLDAVKKRIIE